MMSVNSVDCVMMKQDVCSSVTYQNDYTFCRKIFHCILSFWFPDTILK